MMGVWGRFLYVQMASLVIYKWSSLTPNPYSYIIILGTRCRWMEDRLDGRWVEWLRALSICGSLDCWRNISSGSVSGGRFRTGTASVLISGRKSGPMVGGTRIGPVETTPTCITGTTTTATTGTTI